MLDLTYKWDLTKITDIKSQYKYLLLKTTQLKISCFPYSDCFPQWDQTAHLDRYRPWKLNLLIGLSCRMSLL